MSTFTVDSRAQRVWFDTDNMWIAFSDGRQLSVPLSNFPRLKHATNDQRTQCEISGGGTGLHWDAIDEDISVPNLLIGFCDRAAV
jgi:hypothetical protein